MIMETFYKYRGSGTILIWYLAAVLFLFFREKRRPVRILFLYVPAAVLLLFFNPLFARLFERFLGQEIYFRMWWMVPMTPTLAYSAVCLCLWGKERGLRIACAAVVLILISGTLVYRNPLFSRAENIHHVPWEVVEICDRIKVDGREVRAAFPEEFLTYVRQYSSMVCMPYGRDAILYSWIDDLYQELLKKEIDVERVAMLAKERGCHYVIFSEEKILSGRMEDYGYLFFGKVGEYLIYMDTTMNFKLVSVPEGAKSGEGVDQLESPVGIGGFWGEPI